MIEFQTKALTKAAPNRSGDSISDGLATGGMNQPVRQHEPIIERI